MSGNSLLLVPISYLENIYLLETQFKGLITFESLYGSIVIALQKYTPTKLKTFVFLIMIFIFVLVMFCYILMLACIQYLDKACYVTNINIVDEIAKCKKDSMLRDNRHKNTYDKLVENRNKRNMIDASKKHMLEKFKVLNVTKNESDIKNLNANYIYIPMYRHNLILRAICYMTVFPIILVKNLVYYFSKV